jgi:hypothetical protein
MMVVADVEEIFVPMQEELFVDPQESRSQICLLGTDWQSSDRDASLTDRVYVHGSECT